MVLHELYDYATGDFIREATETEAIASGAASNLDGGSGVIHVDGRSCFVRSYPVTEDGHTFLFGLFL
jgi:O-acetyl-ADP-ribose deacetylase (regulator of RNase III)